MREIYPNTLASKDKVNKKKKKKRIPDRPISESREEYDNEVQGNKTYGEAKAHHAGNQD